MGWVVDDAVARTRRQVGVFFAHEWEAFCAQAGISVLYDLLPDSLPGISFGDLLILDVRLSAEEREHVAWHELAHHELHVGDCRDWLQLMACGDLCVQKFERQADEFAALFPDWTSCFS